MIDSNPLPQGCQERASEQQEGECENVVPEDVARALEELLEGKKKIKRPNDYVGYCLNTAVTE